MPRNKVPEMDRDGIDHAPVSHHFLLFFLCTQHVIQGQNDIPEAEVNALAKCLDFDAKKLRDFRRICAAPCAVRQRSCQEAHALPCQAQLRL